MKRKLTTAGLFGTIGLLWLGVAIIAVGAMVQSRSAAFRAADNWMAQDILWQAMKQGHKPGIGLGWSLSSSGLAVGVLGALIALAYTLGLTMMRSFCGRAPEIGQPLAALFGLLCLVGTGFCLWLAVRGPFYQPRLLSVGYGVAASGLAFATVVAGSYCRMKSST